MTTRKERARLEILDICIIAYDRGKLAHRVNADYAFEREIGLQAERASEIIGRHWWVLAYASSML